FFQAEDGIRDDLVTGVQTCALPIYRARAPGLVAGGFERVEERGCRVHVVLEQAARLRPADHVTHPPLLVPRLGPDPAEDTERERSEERRVGKEGRAWGSRDG